MTRSSKEAEPQAAPKVSVARMGEIPSLDWNAMELRDFEKAVKSCMKVLAPHWQSRYGVSQKAKAETAAVEAALRAMGKAAVEREGRLSTFSLLCKKEKDSAPDWAYADLIAELPRKRRMALIAAGDLPWRDEPRAVSDKSLSKGRLGARRAPDLSGEYAAALCLRAMGEDVDSDGLAGAFAAFDEHLESGPAGRAAADAALSSALKWVKAAKDERFAPLSKSKLARLDRALAAGAFPSSKLAEFKGVLESKWSAAASEADRLGKAAPWALPAWTAIRGGNLDVFEHIRAGALAAGVDLAADEFDGAILTEGRSPSKCFALSRAMTLFRASLSLASPEAALALARLPGASRPYFDAEGALLSNPFVDLPSDACKWGARLSDASIALAADLAERGCPREAAADALVQACEAELTRAPRASPRSKAERERAIMRQAGDLSDWVSASAIGPRSKARAKSL